MIAPIFALSETPGHGSRKRARPAAGRGRARDPMSRATHGGPGARAAAGRPSCKLTAHTCLNRSFSKEPGDSGATSQVTHNRPIRTWDDTLSSCVPPDSDSEHRAWLCVAPPWHAGNPIMALEISTAA
eukprot:102638-Hanusia_phi.AAC.1